MKRAILLMLALLSGAACSNQTAPNRVAQSASMGNTKPVSAGATPTPGNEVVPTANESKENRIAPRAFAAVDFKDFSYPTNLKGRVTLKDGTRIFERPEGGGGDSFELRSVSYSDLTGDGIEEAIVQLHVVSCGGSCDGGSHLFYFYSAGQKRPRLLSRFETGSAAYNECGLKSFALRKDELTLELFRICRARALSFEVLNDAQDKGGKFEAHSFTRFLFRFAGRSFILKNREVLPFAEGNVLNYQETVSVN